LLWFDPRAARRIYAHPELKAVLEAGDGAEPDPDCDPDASAEEVESRRDVFRVVARGTALDAAGFLEAVRSASRPDGRFIAPFALVAGTLQLTFDESESLRTTLQMTSPLLAGQRKHDDLVNSVKVFLDQRLSQSSSTTARRLADQLKVAAVETSTVLKARDIDLHTERAMLQGRFFQTRMVFGESRIRALFQFASNTKPIPAYLPQSAAKELPGFRTLRARLLVEGHHRQDQTEEVPQALKVQALGWLSSSAQK